MLRGLALVLVSTLSLGGVLLGGLAPEGAAHGAESVTVRGRGKVISGTAGGMIPKHVPPRPGTPRTRPSRSSVPTPAYQLTRSGEIHAGSALRTYNARDKLPNGLVYGDSMRKLDLEGMTPADINTTLLASGFTRTKTVIRDPQTRKPVLSWGQTVPIYIYTHPDGGTVRVKPHGAPGPKMTAQPMVVKSLRWPYDAPGDGFQHEALKVTNGGDAIPRWPRELQILPGTDRGAFITTWAHLAHTDLPPGTGAPAGRAAGAQTKTP